MPSARMARPRLASKRTASSLAERTRPGSVREAISQWDAVVLSVAICCVSGLLAPQLLALLRVGARELLIQQAIEMILGFLLEFAVHREEALPQLGAVQRG